MALPDKSYQEQQDQLPVKGKNRETVFDDLLQDQDTPEPLSQEITERKGLLEEPSEEYDANQGLTLDYVTRQAMGAMYSDSFPLLKQEPGEEDWVKWGESLWDRHASAVTHRLHIIERNRLFRMGVQWISSLGTVGWREPPKPRDVARVVDNVIAPALDQRAQIISEQRPGFKAMPHTQDPDAMKRAEAQQAALEYQWEQQEMSGITKEAVYWSGTDGVSFLELYWEPDTGPWDQAFGVDEQTGMLQPLGPDGEPSQTGQPFQYQLGDIKTNVRRIEQVRVSANATSNRKPWYWVLRDLIPLGEAVLHYGEDVAEEAHGESTTIASPYSDDVMRIGPAVRLGYILPDKHELLREQEVVARYTIYCEPSQYLPKGLMQIHVGKKLIYHGPLLMGHVPMVRWADGSTDPAFYPTPIMDGWIDSQMRINAVKSKWVENVRLNAGTKLLAKRQSVSSETMLGGTMTLIEAKGLGSLNDIVKPLDAFSLGKDALDLLANEMKNFENLSGWNDVSRGQFASDVSGRAILAIREQLERIFAPPVNAAAEAMTKWAELSLGFMRWGYDQPRMIGVEGKGRPDLSRSISAQDFDGTSHVFIDPETLMPMPRALRLQLLDDLFARGMLPPDEYRRRLPFAWIRNIEYPDEQHTARARRCAEALRQGQWLPVLWMDNEQIHLDVLEREILLLDDTPQQVRSMAFERWMQIKGQQQMKAAGMALPMQPGAPPPPPMPPQGQPQGKPGMSGVPLPAGGGQAGGAPAQPFAGTNPSVKAGTYNQAGQTDENRGAKQFDAQMQGRKPR